MSDTHWLTALELSTAYASGDLSPTDVAAEALERIGLINPTINAMFHITGDEAMIAARASSERWSTGTQLGRFDGVPTVIKEGLNARGLPNYRGSAAVSTRSTIARQDAPAVSRLRAAGMIIMGKASQSDYGMLATGLSSRHGPARNPWNPDRNTSGSSGGTAAAIAAGFCPAAVGTDIVGSIRQPASFCGLWGLKPTFGVIPYSPPGAPGLCAGPMARSVDDLEAMFELLAAGPAKDDELTIPTRALSDAPRPVDLSVLSFGIIENFGFGSPSTPDVTDVLEGAVRRLRSVGATTTTIGAPFDAGDHRCLERFYQSKIGLEVSELPEGQRQRSPVIDEWSARANAQSAIDVHRDLRAVAELRLKASRLSDPYDFLLTPTVPVTPYAYDQHGWDPTDPFIAWSNCFLFNLTEQPALSMPAGFNHDGLPIGLQLVGHRFADRPTIDVARAVSDLLNVDESRRPNLLVA